MATYTCTTFNAQAKYTHLGDVSQSGTINLAATAYSVGDVLFLAKVPHGAKINDLREYHSTGSTATGLSFGFDRGIAAGGGGNLSILIASGALGTNNNMTLANGTIQISLSDLDPVRYAVLCAKAESGTVTTSLITTFRLSYRSDGPESV